MQLAGEVPAERNQTEQGEKRPARSALTPGPRRGSKSGLQRSCDGDKAPSFVDHFKGQTFPGPKIRRKEEKRQALEEQK
ncbi:uncharacterized protein LOC128483561 isoform X2 [Spea bombifrons]|uniref:uncharacterized protein LOC128483561 isoform X2 n=1 Tax=Spea bombifrons TaxID=233779 RepID=UPI00234A30B0|nr:uncharacterized protein LOC128483561 isoform X2 [Spea bombifrons]